MGQQYEVILVCDKDDNDNVLFNDVMQGKNKSVDLGFYSNPCIEYFLLLHIEDCCPTCITAQQMKDKFKVAYMRVTKQEYCEGDFDYKKFLKCNKVSQEKAFERLDKYNKNNESKLPSECVSNSTFHLLIRYLKN